mmetsp:Transcript_64889/g.120741  ORF Transcript_64889/g.120741 Transcript_64889/m.120741 type:complete len:177 (+) Transcript_64889:53-583(+)
MLFIRTILVSASLALAVAMRLEAEDSATLSGNSSSVDSQLDRSEGPRSVAIHSKVNLACLDFDQQTHDVFLGYCRVSERTQYWIYTSEETLKNEFDETLCLYYDTAFFGLIGSNVKVEKCVEGEDRQKWYWDYKTSRIHSRAGKCMEYDKRKGRSAFMGDCSGSQTQTFTKIRYSR